MPGSKCPFSMVQASGASHCRHATEVVRRGGSEFDCTQPDKLAVCTALVAHMNARALPALGHEDDLTLTPKSVYERVLLGGLRGLHATGAPRETDTTIADIWPIVESALLRHAAIERIPASEFVPAIRASVIRKRRHRPR